MSSKTRSKQDIQQVANAFNNYRKRYHLTWERILLILKEFPPGFNFGISKTNIQAIFLIGGQSRVPDHKDLHPKYYTQQIDLLRYLNDHIDPRIVFEDREPVFGDDGNFALEEIAEGGIIPVKLEKDEFVIYYWRHDDTLGYGVMTLFKDSQRANLQLIYAQKETPLRLEGTYTNVNGLVTIRLLDKSNHETYPYTQIVFLQNPDPSRHCYIATWSSAYREESMLPVAGMMLLFRKEKAGAWMERVNLGDLATYILYKKRVKPAGSGFNFIGMEADKLETDNESVNGFFETLKYEGIYEGIYVNPRKQTYETCVVQIDNCGMVEMMVYANMSSKPFEGVARIYRERKDLIISYHYKKEISDYRMKLVFDISRNHPEQATWIYGLMGGLELSSEEPMSSTIAIRRIGPADHTPVQYKQLIRSIDLTEKKGFKTFEKELREKKLYDFFLGRKQEGFTSIGLLHKLKGLFS
jgi:hypothetical protein